MKDNRRVIYEHSAPWCDKCGITVLDTTSTPGHKDIIQKCAKCGTTELERIQVVTMTKENYLVLYYANQERVEGRLKQDE